MRDANGGEKCAGKIGLRRQYRVECGVGDDAAGFFGEEEESFLAIGIVDAGNKDGTAEGAAKIVVVVGGLVDAVSIIQEGVGVENLIAKEFVDAAVEGAGSRAGNHVDLTAGAAAILGVILAANHAKFFDGIDAGILQQSEVCAAINIVCAVDGPIVLGRAAAVDGEINLVRGTQGV